MIYSNISIAYWNIIFKNVIFYNQKLLKDSLFENGLWQFLWCDSILLKCNGKEIKFDTTKFKKDMKVYIYSNHEKLLDYTKHGKHVTL